MLYPNILPVHLLLFVEWKAARLPALGQNAPRCCHHLGAHNPAVPFAPNLRLLRNVHREGFRSGL